MIFVKEKKIAKSFLLRQHSELAQQGGEQTMWTGAVAERRQMGGGEAIFFPFSNGDLLDWFSFNVDLYRCKT